MKKTLRAVVAVLLVCVMIGSLAACTNKLSGTYTSDGIVKQSFTFADDAVVMSAFGIEAEGTYKIEDDKIIITYNILGFTYDWEKSFEKDGNTIIIDGTEFVKQ